MSATASIDLDSDPQSIIGKGVIDAPRALVFEAWSDLKHLSQWWGPSGFAMTTMNFDLRAGGSWRYVMRGPDGQDYQNRIVYEVVRPERIVYRVGGGGDIGPVTYTVEVALEDLCGSQTRLTMRGRFLSAGARARAIAEGADKGLMQTLSRLEQYVLTQLQGKDPVFTTSRSFDAPRETVWAAWTKAEHLMRWWGPKGFTIVKCDMDLRDGGSFHYGVQAPDGKIMWGKWIFREIAQPAQLTAMVAFSDEKGGETRHPTSPTWPLRMISALTFEEDGARTKVTVRRSPLNSTREECRAFAAGMESMNKGWNDTLDQLGAYLAKIGSARLQ